MDINNVTLTGRLTRDPELKYTQAGKAVVKIGLAVGRMKKDEVDFINCTAWEKTAEVIGEYCRKGSQVGIVGRISVNNYEDENKNKRTSTEIIITQLQLLGSKNTSESGKTADNDLEYPF